MGPPIHPVKEQFPMTTYPRCLFLKANVVVCPPSGDLNAGFVKLVEISQISQMVLCIHCSLGGTGFPAGMGQRGLGQSRSSSSGLGVPPLPPQGKVLPV